MMMQAKGSVQSSSNRKTHGGQGSYTFFDKCPAIRPINMGDVRCRLCAKIMIQIIRNDIVIKCSANQICLGVKTGIEGSNHASRDIFYELSQDEWRFALIDA